MPIKPENRARYPKDWATISLAVKERAQYRCEHHDDAGRCKARQYAVGHWERRRNIVTRSERWLWVGACGNAEHDCAGGGLRWPSGDRWTFAEARQFAAESFEANPDDPKPLVIVLTVAHLNHQPEDCRPENLSAMCQRHHLALDHDHHRANAQATRRAKAGTLELF